MSFLRNIPIVRNFLGAGEEERPAAPPARSSPLAAASPFVGVGFGSPAAAAAPSQPAPFTGFGSPSPADRALSGPSLADRERYLASRAPASQRPPIRGREGDFAGVARRPATVLRRRVAGSAGC